MPTPTPVRNALEDLARDADMLVFRLERFDASAPPEDLKRLRIELERLRDQIEELAHSVR